MKKLPISLRVVSPFDIPFIKNSWLTSYRNSTYAWKIPNPVYFHEHGALISNMISKSNILVAVNQDDEDQIFGFIVFEPHKITNTSVIHYLYVKSAYRHGQIATELLDEVMYQSEQMDSLPIVVTHFSKEFEKFCAKVFIYNPYLLKEYL